MLRLHKYSSNPSWCISLELSIVLTAAQQLGEEFLRPKDSGPTSFFLEG